MPNLTFASGSLPLTIDAHQVSGAFVRTADFDKDGMPDLMTFDVGRQASWISHHGVGTVWFDEQWRVTGKSSWGETSIEPPWHNWRKWFKK